MQIRSENIVACGWLPEVTGIYAGQAGGRPNLFAGKEKILLETLAAARQNTAV